jgi:cytochrome c-type biogenesis protein CcmH/NrfG
MRARILIEGSEYLKANSLLDAFATRNRTDKNYLLLRARVFREWNKNVDSAAALIADAQRLYPDDTDVLLASAEICYQTGRQLNGFAGRDLVQTVLRKDSANRTALALLANDYIAASSWPEAVKAAEDLVRISGDDDARLVLLRACLGAGQTARAVALAREIYGGTRRDDTVTGLYLAALIA